MPTPRHSYKVLAYVSICVLALCIFRWWQQRQQEQERAQLYRNISVPKFSPTSTPEQQKALLKILYEQQKNHSSPLEIDRPTGTEQND